MNQDLTRDTCETARTGK